MFKLFVAVMLTLTSQSFAAVKKSDEMRFIQINAANKVERSQIETMGVSIEAVYSDSVWGFAPTSLIKKIKNAGFKVQSNVPERTAKGGHDTLFGFPQGDSKFHDYPEITSGLQDMVKSHSSIARLHSIGKTLEGRDIWAVHLNTNPDDLAKGSSARPGVVFMGAHHAREHVSSEIPYMFIEHLLKNQADAEIARLLGTRDIWIIPIVNPDGSEYDISSNNYKMWRKNRRKNSDGTWGVDLNRNYGFKWGTGGSSRSGSSDVYMGTQPFSEPETQNVRDFVKAHPNFKVLLSFHTFSELILYPWGHSYDPIPNTKDHQVFEKMATTMAQWNGYKPQQSSDLYIASGDTTDWAYGELGIFAFTFELSPKSQWEGGFYPGQGVLDKVFNDNLRPMYYLIDVADDPYKVVDNQPTWEPGLMNTYFR